MDRVVVVGAGVGGLVSAVELAGHGTDVVVLERAPSVGGKIRRADVGGRPIDVGPTVMTMRWVFEEIFSSAGENLADHVVLHPASRLARHSWGDRTLDLFADPKRTADAIGDFAGLAEARGYLRFCDYAQRIYENVEVPFLRSEKPTLVSALALASSLGMSALLGIDGHRTMWKALGDFFNDTRLRQLFARYSTYCGSSPFLSPATLNVIAHVEREGVFLVQGGMYEVAEALRRLAIRKGVTVQCGESVAEILVEAGAAVGVRLASGERIPARAVVFNGDPGALAKGLLGGAVQRKAPEPEERSLSAITWAMVAEPEGFPLVRHNVFFSSDYAGKFRDLFVRNALPEGPTVYVCAQDRDDDGNSERGAERFLCLVNAPPRGDEKPLSHLEIERCQRACFALLHRCGLTFRPSDVPPVVTTPNEFERLFPATGGALYGAASHGWRAPFSRPGSRTKIQRLYLAGGAVHPGAGVPMAALSGRLAASSAIQDLVSTRRSRSTGMPGGTWTS